MILKMVPKAGYEIEHWRKSINDRKGEPAQKF
jgi:hypothetical protein